MYSGNPATFILRTGREGEGREERTGEEGGEKRGERKGAEGGGGEERWKRGGEERKEGGGEEGGGGERDGEGWRGILTIYMLTVSLYT